MATMIPSTLSPEIKSNAERKIFEWFRDDPDTEGWVVLHSLGIANHKTVLYGELDFFVIAPKLGVFALEVKGGRVKRENGVWYFTDKYNVTKSKKRGPFEQASEGMFSLMAAIKNKLGTYHTLSNLHFGSGVMFPDITFEADGIEGEQWQVFDKNDMKNVSKFIRRLSQNSIRKWEEVYGPLNKEKLPDLKIVKELANLLRGDIDKVMPLSTQINYSEGALITLTEEQLRCLDQLEDNPRCLIQGAAGTGKTLLAIEETKKSIAAGEKVAFFCYNSMLGSWLKQYFQLSESGLLPDFVGTFHSYLYQYINKSRNKPWIPDDGDMQRFYREDLPLLALEAFENDPVYFDKIIIDEAQDLLNEDYLDVFDAILKNGISRGHWSMFGDFTMQAIYYDGHNSEEMLSLVESRTSYIRYKLKVNCRNTKPIGEEIKCLTGFDSTSYLWTKVEGLPVNYITYDSNEDQCEKLETLLSKLKQEGIKTSQITILSPVKRQDSVVLSVNKFKISDYKPEINDGICFSTIQAYKGLENTVIIMTDIESFEHDKLMYVGLSRARSALYILETTVADKQRKKLLMRWI